MQLLMESVLERVACNVEGWSKTLGVLRCFRSVY